MATPPKQGAITKDNFKEAPPWFERFLLLLNSFLTDVTAALNRGLTLRENLQTHLYEKLQITVPDSATGIPFKNALSVVPLRVSVSQIEPVATGAAISAAWSHTWTMNGQNEVLIKFQGLTAGTKYRVTVLLEA